MVTLSLLRHAKSAWNNPWASDFERPLAPRGEKAARRMGAYMVREGLVPELVLCSTALRVRQTLDLVSAEWKSKPEIRYEEGLYHAGPAQMLQYLQALTPNCQHAMIIGHNPGMYSLAANLSGDGDADALDALGTNFPTAALAVIKIEREWPFVGADTGFLQRFVVPRQLPENI